MSLWELDLSENVLFRFIFWSNFEFEIWKNISFSQLSSVSIFDSVDLTEGRLFRDDVLPTLQERQRLFLRRNRFVRKREVHQRHRLHGGRDLQKDLSGVSGLQQKDRSLSAGLRYRVGWVRFLLVSTEQTMNTLILNEPSIQH